MNGTFTFATLHVLSLYFLFKSFNVNKIAKSKVGYCTLSKV